MRSEIYAAIIAGLLAFVLAGCFATARQTYASANNVLKEKLPSVFDRPEAPSGDGQPVCGYLSYDGVQDNNVYPDAAFVGSKTKGLGIIPGITDHQTLLANHNKYVCLTGKVVYRGCGKEYQCAGSDFLYAVQVDAISG